MFLTAATMFLVAFVSAGTTNTMTAPKILESMVQQVDAETGAEADAEAEIEDGFSSQVKHMCATPTDMVWPSTLILRTA